jgi:hypothetical protein
MSYTTLYKMPPSALRAEMAAAAAKITRPQLAVEASARVPLLPSSLGAELGLVPWSSRHGARDAQLRRLLSRAGLSVMGLFRFAVDGRLYFVSGRRTYVPDDVAAARAEQLLRERGYCLPPRPILGCLSMRERTVH